MAVSNKSPVRTLSISSQKGALANLSRKKGKQNINRKEVLKTHLDNPFKLDWPPLEYKDYTRILDLLRESFRGFNWKDSTPPYGSYCYLKKEDRRKFINDQRQEMLAASSEELARFQSRSHFVVGFNSIMRQLEKKQISCIFVNIETKPDIAERMFLPLCAAQSIPLVPLKGLCDIVCKEATLGIKKCRALGLTVGATSTDSPFWQLYCIACEALGIEKKNDDKIIEKVASDKTPVGKTITEASKSTFALPSSQSTPAILTKEQINLLHLRRESKHIRIFRPGRSNENESFISLSAPTSTDDDCAIPKISIPFKENAIQQPRNSVDASLLTSEDMFVLDNISEDRVREPEVPEESTVTPKGCKRTAKYIPAKVKRVKRNPNRKALR